MPIGLTGRNLRFGFFLFIAVLLAVTTTAQARIGFQRSLLDRDSTNLLSQPRRGVSAFDSVALFTPSADWVTNKTTITEDYRTVRIERKSRSTHLSPTVAMSYEGYKTLRYQSDFRKQYHEEVARVFKRTGRTRSGEGIAIDIPYRIKSKIFRRLFGGDNVGVRVQGNITINGNLRQQKFDEQQTANQRNSATSFRIDMIQQFNITGKIGQKVEVRVDQDSERLFDFQNSLKLTYTGEEDEVVQKVEAGNVALNLGTRLATFSGRNTGLFGLKTELKMGALKMIGIASLERGQKNRLSPRETQDYVQPFDERDYLQNVYFFLTGTAGTSASGKQWANFRDNYIRYADRNHVLLADRTREIDQLEVYITQTGNTNELGINGRAVAMQFLDSLDIPADRWTTISGSNQQNFVQGTWRRLTLNTDYTFSKELGFIRLNTPVHGALAVAFKLKGAGNETNPDDLARLTFGTLQAPLDSTFKFVLLKPPTAQPTDSTWNLAWRHVYPLGAANIDRNTFKLRIRRRSTSSGGEELGPVTQPGVTYLNFFQFDKQGLNGDGTPDGSVDDLPALIDWAHGELHFLTLQPFDNSSTWYDPPNVEQSWSLLGLEQQTGDSGGYASPRIYTEQTISSLGYNWEFLPEYKGSTSVFQLGALVLENSEEVVLNGQQLTRGTDYTVDYTSGELRILNEAAKAQGADLQITYESGQFFQLDKKTLLGARAEYELWQDSYVGGMVLNLNEQTLDKRVRIGNEPLHNTLYDLNTSLRFKPNFLTRAVDAMPFVKTDAPSELVVDGEVARVFPNPNSLENPRTGDFNGLAFLDDFEGSRRSSPLGIQRRQWTIASIPLSSAIDSNRARIRWWNPNTRDQVPVQEVFPDREVNSQVANTLQSVKMKITPDNTLTEAERKRQWAGMMRYLGDGYSDQSRAQFLEFWIKLPRNTSGRDGKLVCDLGLISEDALPNNEMDSEDTPLPGTQIIIPDREYGNDVCSPEEDTGIDGLFGADPADTARWNGPDKPVVPSWDDWQHDSNSDDFSKVNGTEGSRNDESGSYPDTEDLNDNDNLDRANSYFSYEIPLSEENPDIVGENPENTWRLFRIPLNRPSAAVENPTLTNIRWARLYLTGMIEETEIEMVQMDIVSNEWIPPEGLVDTTKYVSAAVINTHENPGYESPPGVAGEIDPITNLRQREQALVLKINQLGNGGAVADTAPREFFLAKNLGQQMNILEYKRLKMFVHGGGENISLFPPGTYQLILRLGLNYTSINRDYYDIVQTIKPGWDPENEVNIAMTTLTQLTSLRTAAAAIPGSGVTVGGRFAYHDSTMGAYDSVIIDGNPTLTRMGFIGLGVRLTDKTFNGEGDEIWVDELRVSDIFKESGTAAEFSSSLKLADFVSLQGSFSQRDADFHNVNTRIGAQESSQTWRGNATVNVHKLAFESLGIQLPVTLGYSENVSVPRYIPGTDTRLEPDQVPDSVKAEATTTSATVRFSKTGNSRNPLVRWSVEKMSVGYDYSLDKRTDFNTLENRQERKGATAGYNFPTAKGRGISPMFWNNRIPVLSLLGRPKFYYKPVKLQFAASAQEAVGHQVSRPAYRIVGDSVYVSQQILSPKQFTTSRGITTGFAFIEPFTVDYGRTVRGAFEYENIDTTGMTEIDKQRALANRKIRGGWPDVFNYDFGRQTDIQQQTAATYRPEFVAWFKPTLTYTGSYQWADRDFSRSNSQTLGNSRTIGGDLAIDFRAILGGGGGRRGRSGERARNEPRDRGREAMSEREGAGRPELPGMGDFERPPVPGEEPRQREDERSRERERPREPQRRTEPRDSLGTVMDTLARGSDSTAVAGQVAPRPRGPSVAGRLLSVISPIRHVFMIFDPISLGYDNTSQHGITGTHGAEADLPYQLGFTQKHGLSVDSSAYTTPESKRLNQTYQARSGIRLTSAIRTQLTYAKRIDETIGTTKTGSTEESKFWLSSKAARSAFPFPDVTLDWSGLEKFYFMDKVSETVSLSSGLANKVTERWNNDPSNVQSREYTRQWSPLAGINVAFKRGIDTQVRYNTSQKFTDNVFQQSKARETTVQINGQVSYTVRTGFRIPVLWLKTMKLQNQTTIALTLDYQNQKQEQTQSAATDEFAITSHQSSWSLQPNMTYSFSSTVQGRAYVTLQQNRNEIAETKSRTFEFGIQVNIAIRG